MIRLHEKNELNENQLDCFEIPRVVVELYDVVNDPYQLKNLAFDSRYAMELLKMEKLLDDWKNMYNDTIPGNPTPDKFDRWTGDRL
jgi:hypothetical protein